ncbi:checkpoint protein HUS1-like isoform X8 [Scaptodrosophila lebanonensis]|uniref:Checkpoint protein n=1 Tax=Drosophila lebanonensis TaxID=7225 RepID=A0A6J2TFN5_DROLE|nr:checkpoint protein HUS1-like isoform X8 [Scaptodrosophila lebanonensis]
MRFRARMQDALYMREFQSIIATLAKLAKECIMILADQQMHFIVNEEHNSTTAPLVWASIAAADYFPEYKMVPAREDHPYIVLAMSAAHLSRALAALRTGATVNSCKLKLQRIQFPCFSVIASVVSQQSAEPREVVHDVPVNVVAASDWPAYKIPKVPTSQLVLSMPSLRMMRNVIDSLKNMSPTMIFHANAGGELNLVAESEMVTITTAFRHLLLRRLVNRDPTDNDEQQVAPDASCSVDCRKASSFFSALQLPNEELSIGIDSENCIHLQLDVRESVVLHSILPAVCF